ncbi:MAG: class I SAM-dependent methyltransferase [Vicinamibacteria bacterium]
MLNESALERLACPLDGCDTLRAHVFEGTAGAMREAVILCPSCRAWFPVEDGIADFLTGTIAYGEDRARFWARHEADLRRLGAAPDAAPAGEDAELQRAQQRHFDWYADNEKQSYEEYERLPFWIAADAVAFDRWRPLLPAGGWLLDVGCGPGRATVRFRDLDLNVLAFDVSKAMVRKAAERFREPGTRARGVFLVADAMRFPVRSSSLDGVLAYGVLHHVPDPKAVCREIARVLAPGGVYVGSENNETVLRAAFELLQRLRPLWYEEAGPEALLSARRFAEAFSGTGLSLSTFTSVFLPPHLLNAMPPSTATRLLAAADRVARAVPGLRANGGLILVEGRKPRA